jgi:hypothetical protein
MRKTKTNKKIKKASMKNVTKLIFGKMQKYGCMPYEENNLSVGGANKTSSEELNNTVIRLGNRNLIKYNSAGKNYRIFRKDNFTDLSDMEYDYDGGSCTLAVLDYLDFVKPGDRHKINYILQEIKKKKGTGKETLLLINKLIPPPEGNKWIIIRTSYEELMTMPNKSATIGFVLFQIRSKNGRSIQNMGHTVVFQKLDEVLLVIDPQTKEKEKPLEEYLKGSDTIFDNITILSLGCLVLVDDSSNLPNYPVNMTSDEQSSVNNASSSTDKLGFMTRKERMEELVKKEYPNENKSFKNNEIKSLIQSEIDEEYQGGLYSRELAGILQDAVKFDNKGDMLRAYQYYRNGIELLFESFEIAKNKGTSLDIHHVSVYLDQYMKRAEILKQELKGMES